MSRRKRLKEGKVMEERKTMQLKEEYYHYKKRKEIIKRSKSRGQKAPMRKEAKINERGKREIRCRNKKK